MRISIITASFHCAGTIADCIRSIIDKPYPDIEHRIIDGGSDSSPTQNNQP
ncbi:MAG: glycosyltransferase [Nitrospirota bacterium]